MLAQAGRGEPVRFGIIINAGDPRVMTDLAAEAESAGWDGVFTYDAINIGAEDTYDPWVVLAGMAMRTARVKLGAFVFAPTRRRPWKLAREATTLDHLSAGRLVLPVGLGTTDDRGLGGVGEVTDTRRRAAILDETLTILAGLWTGEPFAFRGEHYQVGEMTFKPRPVQQPRIPIWVVGAWPRPRSVERALRWDGIIPQVTDPAAYREVAQHVAAHRPPDAAALPFEMIADGQTPPDRALAGAIVRPIAEAGATWWLEADWTGATVDSVRRRIAAGPPAS